MNFEYLTKNKLFVPIKYTFVYNNYKYNNKYKYNFLNI
jgi:hypothetical protein